MQIGFLAKFLMSMVLLVAFALAAITYRGVAIFDRDKELFVFDRNGQIASNIATQARSVFREVERKATIFARVYLDQSLLPQHKRQLLRGISDQYGEFVRLQIQQSGRAPESVVHNTPMLQRGGFGSRQAYDRARDADGVRPALDAVWKGETLVANTTVNTDLPVITVAFSLKGASRPTIVVADVSPESFFELFQDRELSLVYLVDSLGRILVHPNVTKMNDRGEDLSGRPVVSRAMDAVVENRQVEFETLTFEDEEGHVQLAAYAPVEFGGASVVTQTPRDTAFAAARGLVLQSWWVPLTIFGVAVVLSVLIGRRVTRPISQLARATEQIGRGNFNVQVDAQSRDELGALATAFNHMGQELIEREEKLEEARNALVQSEKMAAFGQIGAGIAHEVKNPLASILGYAQLSQRKANASPEGVIKYLGIIEKETKRCKDIIENLMKFARQEKAELSHVDIQQVVEESIRLVDHQLSINGVQIVRDFHATQTLVLGNANQIEQVLLNLMVNAQHAMEDKEERVLTVSIRDGWLREDPAVEVELADTGKGIPPDVLNNIFEPFFTTKPSGKGTGLGLSVSYGLIRDHNGDIRAESEVGKGTRFVISLPLAQQQDPVPPQEAVAEA